MLSDHKSIPILDIVCCISYFYLFFYLSRQRLIFMDKTFSDNCFLPDQFPRWINFLLIKIFKIVSAAMCDKTSSTDRPVLCSFACRYSVPLDRQRQLLSLWVLEHWTLAIMSQVLKIVIGAIIGVATIMALVSIHWFKHIDQVILVWFIHEHLNTPWLTAYPQIG